MTRPSSKTLLPERLTWSNAHFELLSQIQRWQRKETVNGTETKNDKRAY